MSLTSSILDGIFKEPHLSWMPHCFVSSVPWVRVGKAKQQEQLSEAILARAHQETQGRIFNMPVRRRARSVSGCPVSQLGIPEFDRPYRTLT